MLGNFVNSFLPDDPEKNEAARAGLLSFGAEMLKGRGNFGGILGSGLQAGAGGYQNARQQQQQNALHAEQQKRWQMENQQTEAALARPGQISAALQGDQPAAPQGMTAPSISAPVASGQPMQPVSALPQLRQQQPTSLPPVARPADMHAQYLQMADRLAQKGFMPEAEKYYKIAESYKPKLKQQTTLTRDGKRVMVNVMEDGSTQELDGFAPDQEKLVGYGAGGTYNFADPFSGKTVATIANTQSADSRATDARERQRMAFDQQKERNAPKGQIVQTEDGPMLVDQRTGTGRVVTGPDGRPLTMMAKPLTDGQSKALLFGTRMQEADKVMGDLAKDGTESSVPGSRAPIIGGVINAFSGDNQQSLDQAKRDFLNAVLRRESGAAIGPNEFENGDKQYFPQVGDSEKVKAQKARNRELAIRGVLVEVPERHRNSITPKAPPVQAGPYSDSEKEARYQAWKRSQGK